MRAPVILLLLFATGLGLGTIQVARTWLRGEREALSAAQQAPGSEIELQKVLVAADRLPSGHFLRAGDMRWQNWPAEALSETFFTESQVKIEDLAGAVVRSGMNAGEPITVNRVVRPGDRGFLAGVLTPGMRAMSVSVNGTTGIAGLVFPGDRVDLILTHGIIEETPEKSTRRIVSETVLTNRRVLAIDQMVDDLENEPVIADNVTLELTPREVEKVNVLIDMGALSLSLRGVAESEDALPPLIASTAQDGQVAGLPPSIKHPQSGSAEPPTKTQNTQGNSGPSLESGLPTYPTYALDSDVSSLLPVPAFAGSSISIFHGSRSETDEQDE